MKKKRAYDKVAQVFNSGVLTFPCMARLTFSLIYLYLDHIIILLLLESMMITYALVNPTYNKGRNWRKHFDQAVL